LFATVVVGGDQLDVVIGNQPFMEEKGVDFATQPSSTLSDVDKWGREGATVLFVASRRPSVESFTLTATIAIQDPARYEASRVVKELEKLGILSFMCTGDNRATALTVARQVGIPDDRVFAEIMPVGKQECIQAIQRGSVAAAVAEMRRRKRWHFGVWKSKARAKVLFVGDGVRSRSFFFFPARI
jgi:P-type E1-E2 ATPase